ncbi:aspartate/glutamate racemase family protein [Agreia sp. Leaf283]|uniref:aspartate/glutamate racemase family protein n=1 Tax=Agreia sp. Leaf283 TaxID=1736321 RepID=UPI0006FC27C7|nr:aspartate/glutamate racemase family protein [Agreia sp. Leaf283]KQP57212.1 hydantoin racemase [Agreia sp. Leaf283]
MRIAIINPNTTSAMTASVVAAATSAAREGTELVGITPAHGVPSIESHIDEVHGAASALAEVQRLETGAPGERPDAYVIACFGDTGVPAAREAASGPVVGMTEAALSTAALIAHRFTVITMPPRTREMSDRVVRTLGLEHRVVVRAIDEPVSAVEDGSLHLLPLFIDEGRRALADDAAEAIVLGCAGLAELVGPLSDALGAPVVEGVSAAVAFADGLLAQGLGTSRVSTWAAPSASPAPEGVAE